jgi:high-affinity iron transporter
MSAGSQSVVPLTYSGIRPGAGASKPGSGAKIVRNTGIILAALVVLGVLLWQGLTAAGNPDPAAKGVSPGAAVLDTGILVFREGLEAILVLAALTASLVKTEEGYWKPVALGAGVSFLASVATWFVVVAVIASFGATALHVQAATGLLAIVVLLVIMNWFFHKIYWTGWITAHNRWKKDLTTNPARSRAVVFRGLALIGFTSVYREGFEVVLFLQSIRAKFADSHVVLIGVAIGLALTLMVAMLTFVAHYKLPYKRMLVLTGVMLGAVLLVMVGEEVQEMQQASWLPTTQFAEWPEWLNTWFGVFATVQSLAAQALAGVFVIGSYYLARRVCRTPARRAEAEQACVVPDCENCELAGK